MPRIEQGLGYSPILPNDSEIPEFFRREKRKSEIGIDPLLNNSLAGANDFSPDTFFNNRKKKNLTPTLSGKPNNNDRLFACR